MPTLITHTPNTVTFQIAEDELVITIHSKSHISEKLIGELKMNFFGKRYVRSFVSSVISYTEYQWKQVYQ